MEKMPSATCHWSISGPQNHHPSTVQQRYCYPRGNDEYANTKGGALWTKYDSDGKEDLNFRLLHIYFSAKRVLNKGLSTTRNSFIAKKGLEVVNTAPILNSPESGSVSSSCLSLSPFSDINDDAAKPHHKDKRGGGAPPPLLTYDSSELTSSPVRAKNGARATSSGGGSSTTTTLDSKAKMRKVTPIHDVRVLNSATKGSENKPQNLSLLSRSAPISNSKVEDVKSKSPVYHSGVVRGGVPYLPHHYHTRGGHHSSIAYNNIAKESYMTTPPGEGRPCAFRMYERPLCSPLNSLPTSRARMNSAPCLSPPILSSDGTPPLTRSLYLLPRRINQLTPSEASSSAAEVALLEFEAYWTDPLPICEPLKVQDEKRSASDKRSLEEVKVFNVKLQVLHSLLVEKIMETPTWSKEKLLDALQTWAKQVAADPLATHNTSAHVHTPSRNLEE